MAARPPRRGGVADTSAVAESMVIEHLRQLTPAQKRAEVVALTETAERLAAARLRRDYPEIDDRELALRLAALRLGRDLMVSAFGWDPHERGW